jgi:hypothetical protein
MVMLYKGGLKKLTSTRYPVYPVMSYSVSRMGYVVGYVVHLVKRGQDTFVKWGVSSLNHCPECTDERLFHSGGHLDGFVLPVISPLATSPLKDPVALLDNLGTHPCHTARMWVWLACWTIPCGDLKVKKNIFSHLKLPTQSVGPTLPRVSGQHKSELLGCPAPLSNAFGSANAGQRKDSLRCVLRLPSTAHGVHTWNIISVISPSQDFQPCPKGVLTVHSTTFLQERTCIQNSVSGLRTWLQEHCFCRSKTGRPWKPTYQVSPVPPLEPLKPLEFGLHPILPVFRRFRAAHESWCLFVTQKFRRQKVLLYGDM